MKCPGRAARATSGACTSQRKVVGPNCFLRVMRNTTPPESKHGSRIQAKGICRYETTTTRQFSTSTDTLPASLAPARAPLESESRDLSRFPGTSARSCSTPGGFPPAPARTGKCGIGWASPDESSSRHNAGTGTWNCVAFAGASGFGCGRQTGVRMPPRSSPETRPRAPGRLRSGTRSLSGGNIRYIRTGTQNATPQPRFIMICNSGRFCGIFCT